MESRPVDMRWKGNRTQKTGVPVKLSPSYYKGQLSDILISFLIQISASIVVNKGMWLYFACQSHSYLLTHFSRAADSFNSKFPINVHLLHI